MNRTIAIAIGGACLAVAACSGGSQSDPSATTFDDLDLLDLSITTTSIITSPVIPPDESGTVEVIADETGALERVLFKRVATTTTTTTTTTLPAVEGEEVPLEPTTTIAG